MFLQILTELFGVQSVANHGLLHGDGDDSSGHDQGRGRGRGRGGGRGRWREG